MADAVTVFEMGPQDGLQNERRSVSGCYEISLGDTLCRGSPTAVHELLRCRAGSVRAARLAGHFHDTAGSALSNIEVALEHGVRSFDSSVEGLGGVPLRARRERQRRDGGRLRTPPSTRSGNGHRHGASV